MAWVNSKSTCDFEGSYQEHSAVLESGKKVFGFSKNLVAPALKEARNLHEDMKARKQSKEAEAAEIKA